MRKPERRLTKKLALARETIRTLARAELAAAAGGDALFDSTDPCTGFKQLVAALNAAPCG
jgi:hypothetical protein